jgi:hypothetical protein
MAWLLHPDDFDAFKRSLPPPLPSSAATSLFAVDLRSSTLVERGHIADSEHPELGMPTFAEFGTRQAQLFETQMREWDQAMTLVKKLLR